MGKIRIGLGRFYNANMVELKNGESIPLNFITNQYEVRIHIGENIRHFIQVFTMSPPEPVDKSKIIKSSNRQNIQIPGPEKFPADLYVEIVASMEIDMPDNTVREFNIKKEAAGDIVLAEANKYKDELRVVLDLIAGAIGLRIDKALVRVPIIEKEQLYAYREGTSYRIQSGFKIELRKATEISASKSGHKYFIDRINNIRTRTSLKEVSEAMSWMLRGWAAEDEVLKFVSYFTALESVIPKKDNPVNNDFNEKKQKTISIIQQMSAGVERSDLISFLKSLRTPTPLNASFEKWARQINFTSCENDILAFKDYNKTRNLLLHTGDLTSIEKPEVRSEDVITLESIATKYLSYLFFGDAKSYTPPGTNEPD